MQSAVWSQRQKEYAEKVTGKSISVLTGQIGSKVSFNQPKVEHKAYIYIYIYLIII